MACAVLHCGVDMEALNPIGGVLCSRFEVLRGVRLCCVSQSRARAFLGDTEGLGCYCVLIPGGCLVRLLLDILEVF
jgi:hypothetical protein